MTVQQYLNEDKGNWNNFVAQGKHSTFLFNRNFMDYHSDRFVDHSVIVKNDKGHIIACMPANEVNEVEIHSHQGLTYGGVVLQKDLKLPVVIQVFDSILHYYGNKGFSKLYYKAFPRFYNTAQTDEIEYCLFLKDAKLYRRDTAICVDREDRIKYSGNIRREAKKAKESGVTIQEDQNLESFWNNILIPNLESRFEVKPVHDAQEISLLKSRFPKKLKLYTATSTTGEILAGTVFFLMDNVAHCQYISANDVGRREGALNLLFVELLDKYFQDKRFFDFGIANEDNGKALNAGLLAWKERMGGRAYSHDFYELDLVK